MLARRESHVAKQGAVWRSLLVLQIRETDGWMEQSEWMMETEEGQLREGGKGEGRARRGFRAEA